MHCFGSWPAETMAYKSRALSDPSTYFSGHGCSSSVWCVIGWQLSSSTMYCYYTSFTSSNFHVCKMFGLLYLHFQSDISILCLLDWKSVRRKLRFHPRLVGWLSSFLKNCLFFDFRLVFDKIDFTSLIILWTLSGPVFSECFGAALYLSQVDFDNVSCSDSFWLSPLFAIILSFQAFLVGGSFLAVFAENLDCRHWTYVSCSCSHVRYSCCRRHLEFLVWTRSDSIYSMCYFVSNRNMGSIHIHLGQKQCRISVVVSNLNCDICYYTDLMFQIHLTIAKSHFGQNSCSNTCFESFEYYFDNHYFSNGHFPPLPSRSCAGPGVSEIKSKCAYMGLRMAQRIWYYSFLSTSHAILGRQVYLFLNLNRTTVSAADFQMWRKHNCLSFSGYLGSHQRFSCAYGSSLDRSFTYCLGLSQQSDRNPLGHLPLAFLADLGSMFPYLVFVLLAEGVCHPFLILCRGSFSCFQAAAFSHIFHRPFCSSLSNFWATRPSCSQLASHFRSRSSLLELSHHA